MGKFIDKTAREIVSELNVSYFLPDIQRDYVWLNNPQEKKIEQLFDSILRGYPIGTFLFWKLKKTDIETDRNKDSKDKLNFQLYKFIENYDVRNTYNEKINIEKINSDDLNIVLDGQQRLTSLYIGLKGSRTLRKPRGRWENPSSFEEKKLYLNLRHIPNEENPDDNYQFDFLLPNDLPTKDDNNNWFKVGDILNINSVLEYSQNNGLNTQEAKIIERLLNALCIKSIISFYEESEKNLDKVLKIFIRVNSGGTQLSYSDLLMSILTANFSTDIRDMMQKLVESFRDKGFGVLGRDQILKTCLLLTGSNHIFNLKNFSKTNISKIEENWSKITSSLYEAIHIVEDFGYAYQLSTAYIISIIALYLYKNGKKYSQVSTNDLYEMSEFVRNAQIKSFFTTSLDNKLTIASNYIKESSTFHDFNEGMKKGHYIEITNDDIEGILDNVQFGNPALFPILQLLYPNLDYKNSKFHIDHIYPKSKFTVNNKSLPQECLDWKNYLFNLQLLEGSENISKRAKDPEVWLAEAYKTEDEKNDYKSRNYIDKDFKLDWERIMDFEKMRRKNIKKQLQTLFNLKIQ
jgi:uncharacterized protein with ParB-like and HNH nuclease domain